MFRNLVIWLIHLWWFIYFRNESHSNVCFHGPLISVNTSHTGLQIRSSHDKNLVGHCRWVRYLLKYAWLIRNAIKHTPLDVNKTMAPIELEMLFVWFEVMFRAPDRSSSPEHADRSGTKGFLTCKAVTCTSLMVMTLKHELTNPYSIYIMFLYMTVQYFCGLNMMEPEIPVGWGPISPDKPMPLQEMIWASNFSRRSNKTQRAVGHASEVSAAERRAHEVQLRERPGLPSPRTLAQNPEMILK